ncbi:MAG: hypothetical protein H6Q48_179 [Deltaproteobacteria bacterium]|nr:hypothetical protein [Deltaproteobacteria bacterium]
MSISKDRNEIETTLMRRLIMKWITRSHVHVDRVACPWLISRFIDSEPEFVFVPKTQVLERAAKEGAIAFDTPGVELQHEGDLCSFDVIIRKFGLTDPALLRMAKVINAADTDRLDKDPLAAGLEAIAVGYGLRFPNDLENLKRQFEVYDALYAWCRLNVLESAG